MLSCLHVGSQNQLEGKPKGLVAFCGLLLKTCEYDAAPVFEKLLDMYRADLSADEALFGVSALRYFLLNAEHVFVPSTCNNTFLL